MSGWFIIRLAGSTHNGLDQAIGSITTTVQNLDRILFSIKEDKEIIVSKQSHLFNRFVFAHWNYNKFFTAGNEWQQFAGIINRRFISINHFSSRTSIAASMKMLAFVAINLALHFLQGDIKGAMQIVCPL